MRADDSVDWALIDRYVSGECSAADAEAVRQWAAADPVHAAQLATAQQVRDVASGAPPQWRLDRMWQGVVRDTAAARDPVVLAKPRTRRSSAGPSRAAMWGTHRLTLPAIGALAAGIVALIAAGVRSPTGRHVHVGAHASYQEYVARRGVRTSVELPDGTAITLAPESRIRVAAAAAGGRRDIELVGEAYFVVRHDLTRPFVVRAGAVVTEDLGTAFDIRAYPADSHVAVVVANGSVVVRDTVARPAGVSSAVHLDAGDLVLADSAGRMTRATGVSIADYLAWTRGQLVFDETPLRIALPALGRWYDLDFSVTDTTLLDRTIRGEFEHTSPSEAIRLLSAALHLRIVRVGKQVTISHVSL